MVKFVSRAVRLGPEVDRIYDATALGGGGFAVAGIRNTGGFDEEKLVWWFDADGQQTAQPEVLEDFSSRQISFPVLASVDGSTVASARQVRPDPFEGFNPTLLRIMDPGPKQKAEREVFDGTTRVVYSRPVIDTWGDGFVVGQSRESSRFTDPGLNLLRLDSAGETLFETIVPSEQIIRSYDLTEQQDGGLAVVAGYFLTANRYSIRVHTLDGTGEVETTYDLNVQGAETSLNISYSEPLITELANGDLLVTWYDDIWFAQKFDSEGGTIGGEVVLAAKNLPIQMDILALDTGGFLAAWREAGTFPNSILVREFDALGNPEGPARTVTDTVGSLSDPTLFDAGDADIRLVWFDSVREDNQTPQEFTSQFVMRALEDRWIPGKVEDGGGGRDRLTGTNRDDILSGGVGRDVLQGRKGQDDLRGDAGDDRILGNGGADVLEGGRGNDRLLGAKGNDVIVGGAGNDRLTGGEGVDTFIFRDASGIDRIKDFDDREDIILLEGALSGAVLFSGVVDDFDVVETGGDTILRWDTPDIEAQIILEGVVDLNYDTNLLFGPIFAY